MTCDVISKVMLWAKNAFRGILQTVSCECRFFASDMNVDISRYQVVGTQGFHR